MQAWQLKFLRFAISSRLHCTNPVTMVFVKIIVTQTIFRPCMQNAGDQELDLICLISHPSNQFGRFLRPLLLLLVALLRAPSGSGSGSLNLKINKHTF